MPPPRVGTRMRVWRLRGAWGGGVFAVSATQAVCQAEQRPADGPTLFPLPVALLRALNNQRHGLRSRRGRRLANQSLRDQFQIAVKFQMIFLCVAAAAAFHFEFTLVVDKSYDAAPTTLRRDQRCNALLVGRCAVGPGEGAVQHNKRTKSEGKAHGPPTQVGPFGVGTTSAPRACSRLSVETSDPVYACRLPG
jgi:hypothetical protein